MSAAVEDFVYDEAALLDDADYDRWLALWADECVYWAPYRRDVADPAATVNLIYDDRARLGDRVHRLLSGDAHAQDPPSVTSRLVGPVRPVTNPTWRPELAHDATFAAGFLLTEVRRGERRQYTGRATYWLRGESDGTRLVAKRVDLLEAVGPLGNLTILL